MSEQRNQTVAMEKTMHGMQYSKAEDCGGKEMSLAPFGVSFLTVVSEDGAVFHHLRGADATPIA